MSNPIQPQVSGDHPAGLGGTQDVYIFENGYGASVVCSSFSYGGDEGLWELAVLKFTGGDPQHSHAYDLCYDTEITGDVIGHLDEAGVQKLLRRIQNLPRADGVRDE